MSVAVALATGDGPGAGIIAALIIASAGFVAALAAAVVTAVTQRRLAWHQARHPVYARFLDAASRSVVLQEEAADLVRVSRWDPRPIADVFRVRREMRDATADLRIAVYSVQLVASPKVFAAADRVLAVVAAGAEVLRTVRDGERSRKGAADRLRLLGEELLTARDDFVDKARRELRLKTLADRPFAAEAIEQALSAAGVKLDA